ncbi:MAG: hypothetical protein WCX97_01345 [Candidatus Magasanikbacteria bacterium]
MKKNYEAWLVDEKDYPRQGGLRQKLEFILRYAILAPSAHNTQPWCFKIIDNKILVYINQNRALGVSDIVRRQTYESIGACLTNLQCALCHFGFKNNLDYHIDSAVDDNNHRQLVATIFIGDECESSCEIKRFFTFIQKRHSAKLAYLPDKLSDENMGIMQTLVADKSGINLHFFSGADVIKNFSQIVALGTIEAFNNKEFCRELSEWVRPSWTKRGDGMPASTVGIPFILSGLVPFVIAHFNTGKMQARDVAVLVKNTPTVGIISVDHETPLAWIQVGEGYQLLSLFLTSIGFDNAPMGAPIESDAAKYELKISAGITGYPAIFFRIGVQKKVVDLAPRLSVQSCITV